MTDRGDVYRKLAEMYGWGPDAVSRLTPAQQLMYLEDQGDDVDPRTGHRLRTWGSMAEYRAYQKAMGG